MSQAYNEFKLYRDRFGMNQLTTNGVEGDVSQNGALFTLEYLICLLADENTPEELKKQEIERLISVYKTLEVFPGISVRQPESREFDSMDNTGAIAAFSGLFDGGRYSKLSYEHGDKTHAVAPDLVNDVEDNLKYYTLARIASVVHCLNPVAMWRYIKSGFTPKMYWNNNVPEKFCMDGWHGRSPGHIAFLKLTAGKFVGPIGLLSIAVGQFLGCFAEVGNTDARKLPYCHWQYLKDRGIIWKLLYKLWCFILMRQYKNGMKDVYSIYYQDPNHPLKKYSKPYVR